MTIGLYITAEANVAVECYIDKNAYAIISTNSPVLGHSTLNCLFRIHPLSR